MPFLRTVRLRFMAAAVCLSCLGLAQVGRAQTSAADTSRATELFKTGKQAFGRGDMAEAEKLFAQAFTIRKSSDIAANLGQAELEQQKFRSAADHFAWALANLLPSATDAQRKAVETALARARAEVASLRLNVKPDGAAVLVGEHALGAAPIAQNVFVDPGEVIVSVKHDGYVSVDKRLMLGKGTEQAVDIELTPRTEVEPTPTAPVDSGLLPSAASSVSPSRGRSKSLVPAYVATGVAVAGGVVGLVFTLSANSKEDDADARRAAIGDDGCSGEAAGSRDCSQLKDERESVDASRNLALGAFIVGGVAAVAAGYFYWDALAHRRESARVQPLARQLALLPSLELGRARSSDDFAFQAMHIGLSGKF